MLARQNTNGNCRENYFVSFSKRAEISRLNNHELKIEEDNEKNAKFVDFVIFKVEV